MQHAFAKRLERFRTNRLVVAHWSLSPVSDEVLEQLLTPKVLAPLPPTLQLANKGVAAWRRARAVESDVYSITTQEGDVIGLLIAHLDESNLYLGYLIAVSAWGNGFATEVLMGLVAALDDGTHVTLHAGVSRNNPASAAVLTKAGFTRVSSGDDMLTYSRRAGST